MRTKINIRKESGQELFSQVCNTEPVFEWAFIIGNYPKKIITVLQYFKQNT